MTPPSQDESKKGRNKKPSPSPSYLKDFPSSEGRQEAPHTSSNPSAPDPSRAPLLDHLMELRRRLIVVLLALGLAMIVCFFFSESIFNLLLWPYERAAARVFPEGASQDITLIYTQPLEYFFVKLRLALFGGLVLSFPVTAYQLYRFIAPGLYLKERSAFLPYLFFAPFLFILGASLVFFVVFPFVMTFALSQQQTAPGGAQVTLLPKVSDYLNLSMTLFLAFGVSFQLPVVLSLMGRAGFISAHTLRRGRKYALVGVFAFAAFVTPPDIFSQLALGGCIYLLYEAAIISVSCIERQKKKTET